MSLASTIRAIEQTTGRTIAEAIPKGVFEASLQHDLGDIDKNTYHSQVGNTLRATYPDVDVDNLLILIELYFSYCI